MKNFLYIMEQTPGEYDVGLHGPYETCVERKKVANQIRKENEGCDLTFFSVNRKTGQIAYKGNNEIRVV